MRGREHDADAVDAPEAAQRDALVLDAVLGAHHRQQLCSRLLVDRKRCNLVEQCFGVLGLGGQDQNVVAHVAELIRRQPPPRQRLSGTGGGREGQARLLHDAGMLAARQQHDLSALQPKESTNRSADSPGAEDHVSHALTLPC